MVLHCEEDGLVFRTSEHPPDVICQVLCERGWIQYDEENSSKTDGFWNLWWKTQRFRKSEHDDIAPWQRLNHFPRTDAITRKDCLVRNLRRMRCVHGVSVFDFHPNAYILPNEYTKFVTDYAKESHKTNTKNFYWICKPVDLSRGRGIFVFQELKDLSYDCSVVVQRYIANPFLISGYKFDMRIYVCVPSFQPLTIYIYQEGIVRFGTDKFDLNQLKNVYSHLTNTSINKYGPAYSADKERVGSGCKWTLSQLRSYLRQMDAVDEYLLWCRISNIITSTLATQAPSVPKCQNCFELFGFDILVDDQMKPWLLEVNFSPALSMDCQADFIAKRALINDLIDLLNFKENDREHGGESFRSCASPYLSIKRSTSRDSVRSSGKSPGLATSKKSSLTSTGLKKLSKTDRYELLSLGNKAKGTAFARRKSDTKVCQSKKDDSFTSRCEKNTRSVSLPQVLPPPADTLDLPVGTSSLLSSFPRNPSSSSVASSVSSIDHSNQPENSPERPEDQVLFRRSLFSPKSTAFGDLQCKGENEESHSDTSRKSNSKYLSSIAEMNTGNTSLTGDELRAGNRHRRGERSPFALPMKSLSPKIFRKKKTLNSMSDSKQTKATASSQSTRSKTKPLGNYRSPYSIASTAAQRSSATNPWPRTRVGDFILTFPQNDAMRKASGSNFNMKTILREQQKILKKLIDNKLKQKKSNHSHSTTEAIQLNFQLRFDEKDRNPLYFWGPQNPPLLSKVLSES